MPKPFERARARGAKVRTVTKGPNKGKLIAIEGRGKGKKKKLTLGAKRGHKK